MINLNNLFIGSFGNYEIEIVPNYTISETIVNVEVTLYRIDFDWVGGVAARDGGWHSPPRKKRSKNKVYTHIYTLEYIQTNLTQEGENLVYWNYGNPEYNNRSLRPIKNWDSPKNRSVLTALL